MNKNYERLNEKEYQEFQKGRAFYCFFVKKDYKLSISLLKKIKVPPEEVILLFTELYHKHAIDQMIDKFEIKVENIPYLENQLAMYGPMIESLNLEQKRKRTINNIRNRIMNKSNPDEKCLWASGTLKGRDKVNALQTFLLYFLDCRKELAQKLKDIKKPTSMLDKVKNVGLKKHESAPFFPGRFNARTFRKKRSESIGIYGFPKKYGVDGLFDIQEETKNNSNVLYRKQSKCDMAFIELQTSLIDDDYDLTNDNDVSLLLTLTMMCEIFIFHALLILQKEDPKWEDLYRNEFFSFLNKENSLPVDFCTDLLIKHKLNSDACKFLFIKGEYGRLMEYIQDFYDTTQDSKWLKKYALYIK